MDVINMDKINELRLGLETAYIDGSVAVSYTHLCQYINARENGTDSIQ